MLGTLIDSNVRKSTSHHWSLTVMTPACARSRRHLRRDDVQHVRLHVVGGLEPRRQRRRVDAGQHVIGSIFDDALELLVPRLHEQRLLRLHVFVAVEDQHLAARLGALEIPGDLAGALVRPWRAAVRRARNGDREHAAVGHRLELPAQRDGLRPGLATRAVTPRARRR